MKYSSLLFTANSCLYCSLCRMTFVHVSKNDIVFMRCFLPTSRVIVSGTSCGTCDGRMYIFAGPHFLAVFHTQVTCIRLWFLVFYSCLFYPRCILLACTFVPVRHFLRVFLGWTLVRFYAIIVSFCQSHLHISMFRDYL